VYSVLTRADTGFPYADENSTLARRPPGPRLLRQVVPKVQPDPGLHVDQRQRWLN